MASRLRRRIQAAWKRRHGPIWRSRLAAGLGAVALGLVAIAFARLADEAQALFGELTGRWPYAPLILTPAGLVAIVAFTRRFAPASRGSGIPQVIAAAEHIGLADRLMSPFTGLAKLVLTLLALLCGASVGREGPTVQVGAAIMMMVNRLLGVPITSAVLIAGGAAGVAAAFNAPLAGVAFAIEELAAAYEQRLALLVMAAVMLAGFVSLGIAGDYVYFGSMRRSLPLATVFLASPVAGVIGGLLGGLFARGLLALSRPKRGPLAALTSRPLLFAAACGLAIGVIGILSHGLTWGTGYAPARALVEGHDQPWTFAPAKFAATFLTSASGAPGGIFAPSLATGAGVGDLIALWFGHDYRAPIVVLGMIAYFVGVVRAPLTGVIIVSEMTDDRAMIVPLFLAAIVADFVSKAVCNERLYYGLSRAFADEGGERTAEV